MTGIKSIIRPVFRLAVAAGFAGVAFAPQGAVAGVADFYQGKRMKMVIGYPPGSGYDLHARALARHMHRHIPGKPKIIAQNMPGAGSLKAANYLYNLAPKDGTVMGAINRSMPMAHLLGTLSKKKGKFDPLKFNWIGSMSKSVALAVFWHTTKINSFKDAFTKEYILTSSSPTSDSVVFPTVLNRVLGTKFRMITGHRGSSGNFMAMERGEAEGYVGTTWSSLKTLRYHWIRDKKIKILAQISTKGHPELTHVPLIATFAKTELDKKVLALILAPQAMGRPYFTTPGVPSGRVQALRAAFDATMTDPEFLAEAKRTKIQVSPLNGAGIEDLLRRIHAAPADVIAAARKAVPKRGRKKKKK